MRGLSPWQLGFGVVVGLGLFYFYLGAASEDGESPGASAWSPTAVPALQGDSVLIVEVESRDLLERLRDRLPRQRVLLSERDVIAIEDCIFAYDLEKVGAPLSRLGWSDRPLEIVARERGVVGAADASATAAAPSAESSTLAELAKKPTLTRSEAMALLTELDSPAARRR